jgi:hypothetical protein
MPGRGGRDALGSWWDVTVVAHVKGKGKVYMSLSRASRASTRRVDGLTDLGPKGIKWKDWSSAMEPFWFWSLGEVAWSRCD